MELLRDLDVLVLNALRERPHPTHLSLPEAVEVIRELQPRRAYLVHLSHELGHAEAAAMLPEGIEVAYDGLVRDVIRGGGQALVVQTNNATYGRTGQTEQQLAMSRLRAVEHGRPVLIAATSGISAVIAADGSIVQRSAEFAPELLVHQVPLRTGQTVATRVGAVPEWLLALAGLAAVAWAVWSGRSRTPDRARGPGIDSEAAASSGGSGGDADPRDTVESTPSSAQ